MSSFAVVSMDSKRMLLLAFAMVFRLGVGEDGLTWRLASELCIIAVYEGSRSKASIIYPLKAYVQGVNIDI